MTWISYEPRSLHDLGKLCVQYHHVSSLSVTHLKQTLSQSPPDLRPQIGAEEEQGDFGHRNERVIQESPFGALQTASATVSPCLQDYGGDFGDEFQVSRHGLHFHRPVVRVEAAHFGAALRVEKTWKPIKKNKIK